MYRGYRREWCWLVNPIRYFRSFDSSLGKTESTKLMVSHIIHCSGDATDRELQNRIIEVCIQFFRFSLLYDRWNSRLRHYWKHLEMLRHVEILIPVDLGNIYN